MSTQRQARFLNIIERYFALDAKRADALLALMTTVEIPGGDWLFHQGEPSDALYFVVQGRLQVWLRDESGSVQGRLLGEVSPGESVGEIGLLTDSARPAGIRSIRDSQVLRPRIRAFNESAFASEHPTQCCAGIGYGRVFRIGPNLAQGDEMNRASKLGEDIARANETLLTERAFASVCDRDDVRFEAQDQDDQMFPFFRATRR